MKSNDEIPSINQRLDTIIGILLNQKLVNDSTLGKRIQYLAKLGFDNNEIASMLDTTYGLVAKEKSKGKKVKKNE